MSKKGENHDFLEIAHRVFKTIAEQEVFDTFMLYGKYPFTKEEFNYFTEIFFEFAIERDYTHPKSKYSYCTAVEYEGIVFLFHEGVGGKKFYSATTLTQDEPDFNFQELQNFFS